MSARLPAPGSEAAPDPVQTAWPDDPEQRKVREAQERERLHLAYCRGDMQWKERALNKDRECASQPLWSLPRRSSAPSPRTSTKNRRVPAAGVQLSAKLESCMLPDGAAAGLCHAGEH